MAQQRQTYHHKDLRNALIETGIQLVSTEGVNAFSLRKVAAACGVSHAAPYSHFQNKEELLEAMQLFITNRFSKQLESTVQKNNNVVEILKDMGIAYPYHETSLCTSSTTYTGNPQKPLFVSSSTPCHQ